MIGRHFAISGSKAPGGTDYLPANVAHLYCLRVKGLTSVSVSDAIFSGVPWKKATMGASSKIPTY